jgi:undecaprenyl-diphosphatase
MTDHPPAHDRAASLDEPSDHRATAGRAPDDKLEGADAERAARVTSPNRDAPEADGSTARIGSVAWLLLACLSFAGFIALALVVAQRIAIPLDQALLDLARSWGQWDTLWRVLSDSANIPLIVIGIGIVLWLLWGGRRREAILVIILLAAATAGSEVVKQLVGRPRPLGTDPSIPGVIYSFPSGHTLEAATIYGIIGVLIWRGRLPVSARMLIASALTVLVILVGIARVALAQHYPSDVLAGLLAGVGDLSIFAGLSTRRPADRSGGPGVGAGGQEPGP